MRLMISTTAKIVPQLAQGYAQWMGLLLTPRNRQRLAWVDQLGIPLAADNDCFGGLHVERYMNMLDKLATGPRCEWVTVPDVVADSVATLTHWQQWRLAVVQRCPRLAYVAQDGATEESVPWGELHCLFIGGSTEWKLGRDARHLIAAARARQKWVHVGRVNSFSRLDYFHALGCDSVDGTNVCRWPDIHLPRFLRRLKHLDEQGSLAPTSW